MRLIIIILLFATGLQAQIKSTIILGPGEGGPVSGPADSMGLVIPQGEIVIGTGSKAPGSSDSLMWNAGLFVDAPLNLTGLAAGAVDSILYIDASGFVGKTVVGGSDTNFANANLTADTNRIHDWAGHQLAITNISGLSLSDTVGSIFTFSEAGITNYTSEGFVLLQSDGGSIFLQSPTTDISSGDIILDAPDIILEDPLTLSTWDSILVRHPTTGEIQGRLASTIAGSDSLGRNGTAGRIVFETATKAGNSSANLFWNNSTNRLSVGAGTSPTRDIHIVNASNAYIRMDRDGFDYTDMFQRGDAFTFNSISNGATTFLDFNPVASSGTGNQVLRFFRESNSSGITQAVFYLGNNSGTINAIISGQGADTYFAANNGKVGIGTATPNASAKLDVSSTTQGLLPPRMTGTQRDAISSPAEGLILFNSTTSKLQVRAGGAWFDLH